MAKVKNTGNQPRGFIMDDGNQVVVQPGEEREFNLSEADFNKLKELLDTEDVPSFELSGSAGGVKLATAKEQREAEAKKAEAEAKKAEAKHDDRDVAKKKA